MTPIPEVPQASTEQGIILDYTFPSIKNEGQFKMVGGMESNIYEALGSRS